MIRFTDGETVASYAYNVSGLRIEKTVDGETINHIWDGSQQIIADVVNGEFYEANCYLRGTNLVATYSYTNGNKSGYTYYTQNAHGDVVNLTDADGEVVKSYTYDAFGVEKNIDDADTNAFRYCGEYYDTETGTIYLRARYYQASIGRFISRDSYTGKNTDPLSLNLYTYCHNNPVIGIDPSGHWLNFVIGAAVGALVGGAITAYSTWKDTGKIDWSDTLISAGVGALEGVVAASGYGLVAQAAMSGALAFSGDLLATSINCTQAGEEVDWANSVLHATTEGIIGAGCSALGTACADVVGKAAGKLSRKFKVCSNLFDAFESSKKIGKRWLNYDTMTTAAKEQKYLWENGLRSGKHASKDMRRAQRAANAIMSQIIEKTNFYRGYSSVFGTGVGSLVSTPTDSVLNKHQIFSQE